MAVPSDQWMELINLLYMSNNTRLALGVIGAFFVLFGIMGYIRTSKKLNRNRMIVFQNPDGEVAIAVSAIEEYVRKVAKDIPNIVNVRSRVRYHKRKGLNVISDIVISTGTSVPQVTERIQMEVKNKIHTMLGIEEKIKITTNVKRITGDVPTSAEKELDEENSPFQIPFR
jgi:uncharacterized alkaline shock family protein YloU